MKKFVAILVAMILCLSCVSAMAETFVSNTVYAEAGYEGDCYNGVANVLTLKDDGTFVLVDNTSIIQASYIVVTNWFTTVTGTYTVTEEDDGVKVVTLNGTEAIYVMNGSATTSDEDPEILEDYVEMEVECDTETFALTIL